jgi:ribosomal protein L29
MFFITTTILFIIKNGIRKSEIEEMQSTINELKFDMYQIEQQKDMQGRKEFVRFLDESRDMAFEYIENAQVVISGVIEKLNNKTTKKDIKEIVFELKDLLPKDK